MIEIQPVVFHLGMPSLMKYHIIKISAAKRKYVPYNVFRVWVFNTIGIFNTFKMVLCIGIFNTFEIFVKFKRIFSEYWYWIFITLKKYWLIPCELRKMKIMQKIMHNFNMTKIYSIYIYHHSKVGVSGDLDKVGASRMPFRSGNFVKVNAFLPV